MMMKTWRSSGGWREWRMRALGRFEFTCDKSTKDGRSDGRKRRIDRVQLTCWSRMTVRRFKGRRRMKKKKRRRT